jgi:hypothetical protein
MPGEIRATSGDFTGQKRIFRGFAPVLLQALDRESGRGFAEFRKELLSTGPPGSLREKWQLMHTHEVRIGNWGP